MNSDSDSSLSRDGADKTRDRYEKAAVDTQKAKTAYEQQLREIRQYNNVYVENMAFVIEKCQQMELKRMKARRIASALSLCLTQYCLSLLWRWSAACRKY